MERWCSVLGMVEGWMNVGVIDGWRSDGVTKGW